jgi:uncharacterized protein (DUF362 family)
MLRRDFIKTSIAAGAASLFINNPMDLYSSSTKIPDAVWVEGGEPGVLFQKAIQSYGGLSHFISKGDAVVIKPNIGWDKSPEYAADTNPYLIATIVKECFEMGAAKVKIFDRTCNNPRRCYDNSQIKAMAEKFGAEVDHVKDHKFKDIKIPNGEILKNWQIYQDYLEADKVINVPIAKHHSLDRVTLGLKNLMGVMGGNRGEIHNKFTKKIIDIDSQILPSLTIIDGYRVLLRHGPRGGNLNDVKLAKTLIMSSCIVTADRLALDLFDLKMNDVSHIKEAYLRGLNKFDFEKLNLARLNLS